MLLRNLFFKITILNENYRTERSHFQNTNKHCMNLWYRYMIGVILSHRVAIYRVLESKVQLIFHCINPFEPITDSIRRLYVEIAEKKMHRSILKSVMSEATDGS